MKPTMIIPMLVCRDPQAEIDFCISAFNGKVLSKRNGNTGDVLHATLLVNNSLLMVHDVSSHLASRPPDRDGSSSVVLYIYGEDTDTTFDRAIAAGAKELMRPENQSWGDRVGRIVDAEGHVWNIASRLADT